MGFKSAELKDLAERAWGLGALVSASTLARWFRAGELAKLVDALSFYLARARELQQRIPELHAQLQHAHRYRDHARGRIQHFYDIGQVWRQRLDEFLNEYDQLAPDYDRCVDTRDPGEQCRQIIERFEWLRDTAIPACEREVQKAWDNEQYWRDEYKRIRRVINQLQVNIEGAEAELARIERWLQERWRIQL